MNSPLLGQKSKVKGRIYFFLVIVFLLFFVVAFTTFLTAFGFALDTLETFDTFFFTDGFPVFETFKTRDTF